MRNGDATLDLPFGATVKPEDKYSYVTSTIQSPTLGAAVSPDRGALFLGAQMDAAAVACMWRELPRQRVELVVVVNGAELRSGACRYHMDALARVKRMRRRAHGEGA